MPIGRRRNRIDRSLRERGVPPEPQLRERAEAVTEGPWDEADAPSDGLNRVDLGALRLPALAGMELRVDVNAQQQVVGASLRSGESLLQLSVFAAPRSLAGRSATGTNRARTTGWTTSCATRSPRRSTIVLSGSRLTRLTLISPR